MVQKNYVRNLISTKTKKMEKKDCIICSCCFRDSLFFLVFLVLFGLSSTAQGRFDATVFAGLNMSQIDGDGAGSYNHPGLRAGVGTSFALGNDVTSPWRMVVELAFTNKGSHIEDFDRKLSASYIEIPVMMSYNLLEGRLRVAAGVAPAVLVGSKVTNYGAEDVAAQENFTAFDWLPLTVSLRYRFADHLGIEARYQNSFLSITEENGSGTYRIFKENKGCFSRLVSFALTYTF